MTSRKASVMAVVWLCVALAAVRGAEVWSTYHGGSELDGVADRSLPDEPVRLWRTRVGDAVVGPVVMSSNAVYSVNNEGQIVSVGLDGAVLWRTALTPAHTNRPDSVTAPIVTVGSIVAAAADSGTVYALDAREGKILWRLDLYGNIQGTLNYALGVEGRNLLYAMEQAEGVVVAIDMLRGEKVWTAEPTDRCDGHMAVSGDRIVFGNCGAGFQSLSTASGGDAGFVGLGEGCEMAGGVCVRNGIVYSGNRSGSVAAADLAKGAVLWMNEDGQGEMFTTPAADGQHVVFSSGACVVYCLDAATGKTQWEYDTKGYEPMSPVIAGDRVLAVADGVLHLLAIADGKKLWSAEVGDHVTAPAVSGGRIYAGTDDGYVVCFGAQAE